MSNNITFEDLQNYFRQEFEKERQSPVRDGTDGSSAYEIAVDNGFEGTEAEYLLSLKGKDGKSAYELAVENGFAGTEQEFKNQLTEAPKTAYEIAVEEGFVGTRQQWCSRIRFRKTRVE